MKFFRTVRRAFTDEAKLEIAARTATKMLDERDKNILVAHFTNLANDDPNYLFIFARGERAAEARSILEERIPELRQ
jgi:hypothetical protein